MLSWVSSVRSGPSGVEKRAAHSGRWNLERSWLVRLPVVLDGHAKSAMADGRTDVVAGLGGIRGYLHWRSLWPGLLPGQSPADRQRDHSIFCADSAQSRMAGNFSWAAGGVC